MKLQESDFYIRPRVKIPLAEPIQNLLVDDWEQLTKNMNVVDLPSKKPVDWILDTYAEAELKNRPMDSAESAQLEDAVGGLKVYFRVSIGKILLYKYERQQYSELRRLWEPSTSRPENLGFKGPGDCYGIEHLARMITSMEEMFAQTNMTADELTKAKHELTCLQRWIVRNIEDLMNLWKTPSEKYAREDGKD